jgi:hypothetical protein
MVSPVRMGTAGHRQQEQFLVAKMRYEIYHDCAPELLQLGQTHFPKCKTNKDSVQK